MNREILESITLLYVEDEQDVRNFTSKLLEKLVKRVFIAKDGQEGLDLYLENEKNIDLIVTDIHMPNMDGLTMCETIRENNKKIPIVITSAHNDPDFFKRSIEIGINSYAMKPIDLYQLIDSITKAIEPVILKRKLDSLNSSIEEKIELEVSKMKSVLDAQDNIVIVTKNKNIVNANKKFLNFFNIDSVNELKENELEIFNLFEDNFGYIIKSKIDKVENWFSYINELSEIDKVIKMKTLTQQERIFAVNLTKYEAKENYFVFSLTDITEIKERTNLLEYQASHDKLTGLFNRNKFDETYPKEFRRDKRYKNPLSVILLDIDDFKMVNDTYGHHIGDEVLKEISTLILRNIREHDFPVRWGGEEFLVLLPQTNIDGALTVAQKLKSVIESNIFTNKNLEITASFGISKMNELDTDDEMIIKADKALYFSKRNGKNQIKIFEE